MRAAVLAVALELCRSAIESAAGWHALRVRPHPEKNCRDHTVPETEARFKGDRQNGAGSESFRFGFAAVELADYVGANAPERLLVGLRFLAFAVCALVSRADEAALDEDVSAFLDVSENSVGQPRAKNRDAMPLDFRDPFVFGVFPGALRGDGKNGEF